MHRLFIAIRPPRLIRDQLLGLMGGVRGARWQSDEQLHLTLRFIGEVDRHRADDLAAALGAIHFPRFEIALDGVGSFGRRGRIDALWAGVAPQDNLKALHNKIDQAAARAGIAPDQRAFLPHITLARLNRQSGPADLMLEGLAGLTSPLFPVDNFCLYESHLSQEGSHYAIVERYPLG